MMHHKLNLLGHTSGCSNPLIQQQISIISIQLRTVLLRIIMSEPFLASLDLRSIMPIQQRPIVVNNTQQLVLLSVYCLGLAQQQRSHHLFPIETRPKPSQVESLQMHH